jgi:hypothetical protein
MGASVYAAVSDNSDALLPHEEARMREARAHAEMSEILCASLSVAAERIGEALGDGVPSRTLVAGYEARVAEGSEAISLRDLLEERDRVALGQVIASGIDPSLLEVPIDFARWSESMPPQDDGPFTAPQGWVRQTFADAGAATGELGAALGRWARDIDSRPSS